MMRINFLIYTLFLLISVGLQWYILKHDAHNFHIILSGDGGNIASFISGWLYPERFVNDLVLHDQSNFAFYLSASFPFTLLFHLFFNFDIGTAFSLAYAPLIFLQLWGFFLLGKKLFSSPIFGLALALISMASVHIGAGEHWAILHEPISRQWHNAFLPFLILLILNWKDKPEKWFWLFCLSGFSVYLHPVGAPALAFITGFVCLTSKPSSFTWFQHIIKLSIASTGFFIFSGFFIYLYLTSFPALENAQSTHDISTHMFNDVYVANTHALIAFKQFFIPTYELTLHDSFFEKFIEHNLTFKKLLFKNWSLIISIFGCFGYIYAYKNSTSKTQSHIITLTKMIIAVLIVAIIIPLCDQMIAKSFGRNPLQYDLARNIRFIIPLLYIGTLYYFAHCLYSYKKTLVLSWSLFALILCTPIMINFAFKEFKKDYIANIFRIHSDASQHLAFLKEQPPRKILPLGNASRMQREALALRYIALQPVVFLPKDKNALAYSNSQDYWLWSELKHTYDTLMSKQTTDSDMSRTLSELIKRTQPYYLYIDNNIKDGALLKEAQKYGEIILETENKTLIKLH